MTMQVYRMSSAEVAERFGITSRTVQRLAEKGKLDAVKIGGQWRFNADALPDNGRAWGKKES